jgi:hypothetical protein
MSREKVNRVRRLTCYWIGRTDVSNICEMKFSNGEFAIDKHYATELDKKVNVFRTETKTKKTIFSTMITTYGTRRNEYYLSRIQTEVLMEDLFTGGIVSDKSPY